ncbi:hypothetical protein N7490_005446 [Penicillium lividum]|nr:hypothetical protein N7490_005446 [Penicillium lividum]
MPPLRGFSDNNFHDRRDILNATKALTRALEPYFSPGKARVQLPVHSGAHFDEDAAQLEGYARPIWAIAAAATAASSSTDPDITRYIQYLVEGLANGVNPAHPEYWGAIGDWDQRMVEAEPISFALLIAPKTFYERLSDRSRSHLFDWLSGLNGKIMPENNWRWFRIFANLALTRVCGVPYGDVEKYINDDFSMLDRFELVDGWSADGIWRDDSLSGQEVYGRQADYYSGSFAIQYSQLLYCIIAEKSDPERVARYRNQAIEFACQFWRFFDEDGAAIPFGRSLTYRFAMGAFYAAFALAKCYDISNHYTSPAFVKGMLLRHLRWWAKNSSQMFAADGTLTIGYLYPNMFMCESYNSPQSPYWAMKSFVILALESNDEFWIAAEAPHPLFSTSPECRRISGVKYLPAPSQILCHHRAGQHHFMLSGGQFCMWPLKATEAKYSKFAYSSAFGFSVPTGRLLAQLAPDNTLAISHDDGCTWTTRWETIGNPHSKYISFGGVELNCLQSTWKPWKNAEIEIETTLIPPCDEWPDWHVRIHRIRSQNHNSTHENLILVEGGFAIQAKQPRQMVALNQDWANGFEHEGTLENDVSSLVLSRAGASGLKSILDSGTVVEGKILKSDPNTNLIEPRALIPTIQHKVTIQSGREAVIATAVFAIANGKNDITREELFKRWFHQPQLGNAIEALKASQAE